MKSHSQSALVSAACDCRPPLRLFPAFDEATYRNHPGDASTYRQDHDQELRDKPTMVTIFATRMTMARTTLASFNFRPLKQTTAGLPYSHSVFSGEEDVRMANAKTDDKRMQQQLNGK